MSTRKESLILGLNYAPEATGIAPYTTGLAQGLAAHGWQVRVLTAHPHYPAWVIAPGYGQWLRREQLSGVQVDRFRHFVPSRPRPVLRALSEISFGLRQASARWGKPAAIVSVSPALLSTAIARLRAKITHPRTPFVVWLQDLYALGLSETQQGGGVVSRIILAAERSVLRSASAVVIIHDRFAERVQRDFDLPRDQLAVVRNWTHLPPFSPIDVRAVRESFGWHVSETIVLHSGNMGVKQGLRNVIDAARIAHHRGDKVRFVLAGDGAQRAALQEYANEEPANIQFVPPLNDRRFGEMLQAADVLLVHELPGVSEMAVPSKLTSYFAAARPVLAATDVNGIAAQEITSAEAGVIVPAGDPQALLEGAISIASDPSSASRFGSCGKNYRETVLNETSAINAFDSLLTDLAEGRGSTPTTKTER